MIDTEVQPPKILLIRGRAELDVVAGIPDDCLQMSGTYPVTPEQWVRSWSGSGRRVGAPERRQDLSRWDAENLRVASSPE